MWISAPFNISTLISLALEIDTNLETEWAIACWVYCPKIRRCQTPDDFRTHYSSLLLQQLAIISQLYSGCECELVLPLTFRHWFHLLEMNTNLKTKWAIACWVYCPNIRRCQTPDDLRTHYPRMACRTLNYWATLIVHFLLICSVTLLSTWLIFMHQHTDH